MPGVRDGSEGSPRSSSGGRITPSLPLTPNFSIGSGVAGAALISFGASSFFNGAESSDISFESEAIKAFGSFGRSDEG